jgi:hypothetical protein
MIRKERRRIAGHVLLSSESGLPARTKGAYLSAGVAARGQVLEEISSSHRWMTALMREGWMEESWLIKERPRHLALT